MITEDYVSFETAKLLKEKGFDTVVRHYYQKIDDDITYHIGDFRNWNVFDMWYSMPTLQMAMKWLREVHNLHIIVHPYTDEKSQHWGFIFDKYAYDCWQELGIYITDYWDSYEQATETAIEYCLENLI